MGRALQPALNELRDWARHWLDEPADEAAPSRDRATAATR